MVSLPILKFLLYAYTQIEHIYVGCMARRLASLTDLRHIAAVFMVWRVQYVAPKSVTYWRHSTRYAQLKICLARRRIGILGTP